MSLTLAVWAVEIRHSRSLERDGQPARLPHRKDWGPDNVRRAHTLTRGCPLDLYSYFQCGHNEQISTNLAFLHWFTQGWWLSLACYSSQGSDSDFKAHNAMCMIFCYHQTSRALPCDVFIVSLTLRFVAVWAQVLP